MKKKINLLNAEKSARVRTRTHPLRVRGYTCVHSTACMYIGNTFVRLHLVARNSDADVIVTVKCNMR